MAKATQAALEMARWTRHMARRKIGGETGIMGVNQTQQGKPQSTVLCNHLLTADSLALCMECAAQLTTVKLDHKLNHLNLFVLLQAHIQFSALLYLLSRFAYQASS